MTLPRIRFVDHGDPVGKERPRVDGRSGRIYTPSGTKKYEKQIAKACERARVLFGPDWPLHAAGYWVSVRPFKSSAKKLDGDNVFKSVADALNGVAFDDDHRVGGTIFPPAIGASPMTIVEVVAMPVAESHEEIAAFIVAHDRRARLLAAFEGLTRSTVGSHAETRAILAIRAVVEEVDR